MRRLIAAIRKCLHEHKRWRRARDLGWSYFGKAWFSRDAKERQRYIHQSNRLGKMTGYCAKDFKCQCDTCKRYRGERVRP